MKPFAASKPQSGRNLDPFACRDHAQNLRSHYLSGLVGRIFRAAGRALALSVRDGNARLNRA
jgi:hypothetical protein